MFNTLISDMKFCNLTKCGQSSTCYDGPGAKTFCCLNNRGPNHDDVSNQKATGCCPPGTNGTNCARSIAFHPIERLQIFVHKIFRCYVQYLNISCRDRQSM